MEMVQPEEIVSLFEDARIKAKNFISYCKELAFRDKNTTLYNNLEKLEVVYVYDKDRVVTQFIEIFSGKKEIFNEIFALEMATPVDMDKLREKYSSIRAITDIEWENNNCREERIKILRYIKYFIDLGAQLNEWGVPFGILFSLPVESYR